jgi:methylase of polypeptide subunit release factors
MRAPSAEGARPLKAVLEASGFTAEAVEALLGKQPAVGVLVRSEAYRRRLNGRDPASILCGLFFLGGEISDSEAQLAFAPSSVSEAERHGLIERVGERWASPVRLEFYGDYVFASDPVGGIEDDADHVLGLGPASRTLAALTVRRPVRRALDVGTGCGFQAILASAHAEAVVATDVNPRALQFARFNAALNGVENIEWIEGSWFEPVVGEYDLIVSNPPYVISPDRKLVYRDGDLPLDEVSKLMVREAAGRLAEGGYAHILGNWTHPSGADWRDPIEAELTGKGCDSILIRYSKDDPVGYAALWLRLVAEADKAAFAPALDRWIAYLADHGVETISWGAVNLRRRRGGRNWQRGLDAPVGPLRDAGVHLVHMFEGRDRAATTTPESIVELVEGARIETASVYNLQKWRPEVVRVVPKPNVGCGVRIEESMLKVLRRCDGVLTLREAAERAGVPTGDELVAGVGRLLSLGIVRSA